MIYTYYVEQMNKLVEAINYASDAYWGDPKRFKFAAYINQFSTSTQLTLGAERAVRSEFDITLKGHIIPDTIQKDLLAVQKFSDKSKLIFDVEVINDDYVNEGILSNDRLDQSEEGGLINSYTTLKKNATRNIT